jgi:hypothetical protein
MGVLTNSFANPSVGHVRDPSADNKADPETDVSDDLAEDYSDTGLICDADRVKRKYYAWYRDNGYESIGRGFYYSSKSSFHENSGLQNLLMKHNMELALLGVAVTRDLGWNEASGSGGGGIDARTPGGAIKSDNADKPPAEHPKRLAVRNLQAFIKKKTAMVNGNPKPRVLALLRRWNSNTNTHRTKTKVYFDGKRLNKYTRTGFGTRNLFWQHAYKGMQDLAKRKEEAKDAEEEEGKKNRERSGAPAETKSVDASSKRSKTGMHLCFPMQHFRHYDQIAICGKACTSENLAKLLSDIPALVERVRVPAGGSAITSEVSSNSSAKQEKGADRIAGSEKESFRTIPLVEVVPGTLKKKEGEDKNPNTATDKSAETDDAPKTTESEEVKEEKRSPPRFRFVDPEMRSLVADLYALAEREAAAEMALVRKEKRKKRKAFGKKEKKEEIKGNEADDEDDDDSGDDAEDGNASQHESNLVTMRMEVTMRPMKLLTASQVHQTSI